MKSIFVTGAASGIGKATALKFIEQGWRVGLADLNGNAVKELAESIGSNAVAYALDVRCSDTYSQCLSDFAAGNGGKLDVLFGSAGILEMRDWIDTPLDRQKDILDINVMGVLNGIKAAYPFLQRSDDGRVISMSSLAAVYGIPEEAVYSASKSAVRAITEALNIEFRAQGIWVSDVMVAYVDSPMVRDAKHQARSVEVLGVNVMPEQVADTVFLAAAEKRVHWFVTEADTEFAKQIDRLEWEHRPDFILSIAGF